MGTLRHVFTVDAPLERVWNVFDDILALPEYFEFLDAAEQTDEGDFQFGYVGKFRRVPIQLLVTERVEERLIAWRTVESRIKAWGSVALDLAGASTYVTFVLSFDPPGGRLGDFVAKWTRFPDDEVERSLQRIHDMLEEEAA